MRHALPALVLLSFLLCGTAAAATPPPAGEPDSALAIEIASTNLEGVAAARSGPTLTVSYENRSYRHPAIALGHIARVARASQEPPASVWGIERRLGLPCAAIRLAVGKEPEDVVFPGERSFPAAPPGQRWGSTEHSLDLVLRPLVSYELGRVFDPVLLRFELAPELRFNPWPGARARASLVIPLRNDFGVDSLHPDINRVRPGVSTFDQFGWLGDVILVSASVGVFDENRYGLSAGMARPLMGGEVLLDAQADLTGYLAFEESGVTYSTPGHWTGFAGFSIRPRALPAALRVRGERYLYGDHGIEVQVMRSLGDMDLALYVQRIEHNNVGGVRLALPIPPMVRPVGTPIRAELVDRFRVEYRNEVSLNGLSLSGPASREELLRGLDPGSMRANRGGYRRAAGEGSGPVAAEAPTPVSLTGTTGFINTPWCGVARQGDIEVGFNSLSKKGAYDHRGQHRNDVYYGTIGFLPHIEVGLRWTTIPGLKTFVDLVPDSKLTDSDRMFSGRLELVPPGPRRPGLAVGIEDAIGTRRFHSTYAVTGLGPETLPLRGYLSVGYAFQALTASRHTLDGAFGAIAVRPWRIFSLALEHDSEKVNALAGIEARLGFRARFALIELRHPAVGVGWTHSL